MQPKLPKRIVLDAWALLALIFGEQPAANMVRNIFVQNELPRPNVHISWINLGEVYYTITRRKGPEAADEVLNDITSLPVKPHQPSKADILAAARIKAQHRLSYADAFAVSLAYKVDGTIFTGDPEILSLSSTVKIKRLSRGG